MYLGRAMERALVFEIPDSELEFSFARSEGPGGQNVNKVESKAILRWNVELSDALPEKVKERLILQQKNKITKDGELVISSQRFRDQERNREDCLDKLADMVVKAAHEPKKRVATKPTRAAREARISDKKRRSEVKKGRKISDW